MEFGKHTKVGQTILELQNIIKRRDKEIKEIKTECAEQFRQIKILCTSNDYNGKLDKLTKIEEIASDNFSALVKDLFISEEDEKQKIIELPNTRKSNK